jgi:PAS domain S-box-containing protein
MKINAKLIGLIVISFLVISIASSYLSISTLKQNQTENIRLFKTEFLELVGELFENSSNLFFANLNLQNSDRDSVLASIKQIDPQGKSVMVVDMTDQQFVDIYGNAEARKLLDRATIGKYIQENVLNQTSDFELDNFNKFIPDTTNTIAPSKIRVRIYKEAGLMVGYYKTFSTAKVRIQFIERQNENLYNSYLLSSSATFVSIMLIIAGITIVFMNNIIISPLKILVSGLKQVKEGNLQEVIKIKTKDEIGLLAESFNQMVVGLRQSRAELKEYSETLEEKVVLRTDELSREKDRINAIITSMGDGLIVTDRKNKVLLINPSAQKLLDIENEKAIGKDLTEIVSVYNKQGLVPKDQRPIALMFQTSETVVVSIDDGIFYQTNKGRTFPVALVVTPLKGDVVTGAVVVFKDITEEKKLDDSKTNFISVSSHQLRTPLSAIRWFAEMLLDGDAGKLNKEQHGFVETIYQSSERMANLINLLLQIARVEMGRVKVEPMDIDLKAITQEVFCSLKNTVDAKKQHMVVHTTPTVIPIIKLDREVIWQIIMNLMTNAFRYSPVGSRVIVEMIVKGDFVEYSVKDSGIGIPDDQKDKIFSKFYRATNAVRSVPEGSGLGLFLVQQLVRDWGGKIWFESEEGKGTIFYITIPLKGVTARKGEVTLKV